MEKLAINGGTPVSEAMIPIARPVFSKKTKKDIMKVLESGYVRQGPLTKEFEDKFSERIGSKYAYAVNSGTAALHTAYLSILKPGDEVILPAFTFIATASTVIFSSAKPVFADIDEATFTISPEDIKEKISQKTKVIAPVHLFGNAADMQAIIEIAEDHSLSIVSDAAQAHGTEVNGRDVGSYDTLNCYSFYPTKTMTTGEGGMVTTNDSNLYERGRLIRSHGQEGKYYHPILGLNYRMTDIAAAIGLNQLSNLDHCLRRRRYCGKILRDGVEKIDGFSPQKVNKDVNHSYSYFSVVMDLGQFKCTRDQFLEALKAENIDCTVHYPIPLTRQPAITDLMKVEECPVSDEISKRILSLPMHPELTDEDLEKIISGVEKVATYFQA